MAETIGASEADMNFVAPNGPERVMVNDDKGDALVAEMNALIGAERTALEAFQPSGDIKQDTIQFLTIIRGNAEIPFIESGRDDPKTVLLGIKDYNEEQIAQAQNPDLRIFSRSDAMYSASDLHIQNVAIDHIFKATSI
jgi:hypothetical protein